MNYLKVYLNLKSDMCAYKKKISVTYIVVIYHGNLIIDSYKTMPEKCEIFNKRSRQDFYLEEEPWNVAIPLMSTCYNKNITVVGKGKVLSSFICQKRLVKRNIQLFVLVIRFWCNSFWCMYFIVSNIFINLFIKDKSSLFQSIFEK